MTPLLILRMFKGWDSPKSTNKFISSNRAFHCENASKRLKQHSLKLGESYPSKVIYEKKLEHQVIAYFWKDGRGLTFEDLDPWPCCSCSCSGSSRAPLIKNSFELFCCCCCFWCCWLDLFIISNVFCFKIVTLFAY